MKATFKIEGMSCAACATHVDRATQSVEGVGDVSVNLLKNSMEVEFPDTNKDQCISAIEQSIANAGYKAVYIAEDEASSPATPQKDEATTRALKRLVASLVLTLVLSFFAMGYMLHIDFITSMFSSMEVLHGFVIAQAVVCLAVCALNYQIFVRGFKALVHLAPNMDSLVALSCSTIVVYSSVQAGLFMGSHSMAEGMLYMMQISFESAAMILSFVGIGKYLEQKAKLKTGNAINSLMKLGAKQATVIRDGNAVLISVEELKKGDVCRVKTGETIPCDGVVLAGEGSVDESALTGESLPVQKSSGSQTVGGTTLTSGSIEFKATSVGKDTQLAAIIRYVDEATSSKAAVQRYADKVAGIFVPFVIAISLIVFVAWFASGADFALALNFAVSVLTISCPCALGLAVPTAVMVACGKGAKMGILLKNASALEVAAHINTVIFDKTGTLTEGAPSVIHAEYYTDKKDTTQLLKAVYLLESRVSHPLARALESYATSQLDALPQIVMEDSYTYYEGLGITSSYQNDSYVIGNARLLEQEHIALDVDTQSDSYRHTTPLYVARSGKLVAVFYVEDQLKPTAKQAIQELKKLGVASYVLSGDKQTVVKHTADELGVDGFESEVLPQQKADWVTTIKQRTQGVVVMVGDGINDAPALASANLGIALGAGTDVAIDSADTILMHSDPLDVCRLIVFSRTVMKNIKQNLFWALIYNVISIPVASGLFVALGISFEITPAIGALAMSFSSLIVVANALRINGYVSHITEKNVQVVYHNKQEILADDSIEDTEKDNNMKIVTLRVPDMVCAMCKKHVSQALLKVTGVQDVEVLLDEKLVEVSINDSVATDALLAAVVEAGYKPELN